MNDDDSGGKKIMNGKMVLQKLEVSEISSKAEGLAL